MGGIPMMQMAIDECVMALEQKLSFYKDEDKNTHVLNISKSFGDYGSLCKVPAKLRELNEDAYTPRVVSIGPIHHGEPQVQAMESYKLICLNRFLKRTSLNIKDVVPHGITLEYRIRPFYQDSFNNISTQDFAQIITLDSIFILELLIEKWSAGHGNFFLGQADRIFVYPWIEKDVYHDIMLLDNQLPYKVLDDLLYLHNIHVFQDIVPLCDLVHFYFDNVGISSTLLPRHKYLNLVDFLRCCHAQPDGIVLFPPNQKLEHIRSATELQEAGVEFKKATETTYLTDIQFSPKGVLTIPHLKVDEWTETSFRNMVAFEQCSRYERQCIASYVILMNNIISTPKDADLLVNLDIIENVYNLNVPSLFSNLRKEIAVDSRDFMYNKLLYKLNDYSKDNWHRWKGSLLGWKRMLRRDYFSNPWSIISVIAAFVLLILTVVQTVCSVISI